MFYEFFTETNLLRLALALTVGILSGMGLGYLFVSFRAKRKMPIAKVTHKLEPGNWC